MLNSINGDPDKATRLGRKPTNYHEVYLFGFGSEKYVTVKFDFIKLRNHILANTLREIKITFCMSNEYRDSFCIKEDSHKIRTNPYRNVGILAVESSVTWVENIIEARIVV